MSSIIRQLTPTSSSLTDVLPIQDVTGVAEAKKVSVSDIRSIIVKEDVSTAILQGIDDTTTARLAYGINVISTSTSSDFCARLPISVPGKRVTIVNKSNYRARIFPATPGEIMNGVVNGYFDVYPNKSSQIFICH